MRYSAGNGEAWEAKKIMGLVEHVEVKKCHPSGDDISFKKK